jgi:hypothetical protein
MIPGIVAAQAGAGVAAGGATYLDFVEGVYQVDGVNYDIADLLDDGFDPDALMAQGLFFDEPFSAPPGGTNRPNMTGALLTAFKGALENGGVAVLEIENTIDAPGANDGPLLRWCSTLDASTGDGFVYASVASTPGAQIQDNDSVSVDAGGPIGESGADLGFAQINRIALMFNKDVGGGQYQYAVACNGGEADSQDVGYDTSYMTALRISLMHVEEFFLAPKYCFLRKLELYETMTLEELSALSAVESI